MAILAFIKKNSRELALLNHIANLALYFPVSIILLVIFVTLNLASLPLAYLAAIYTKVKLFFNFWRTSREKSAAITDLVLFLWSGLFFLLLSQFKDAYQFYYHAFCRWKNAPLEYTPFIDIKTFTVLVEIFDSYGGVNSKQDVTMRQVMLKVQERMGVFTCIN